MDIFTRYKAIKQALVGVHPCFYFTGQYLSGKNNVGYAVPAIFIEMPKNLKIDYFPGKWQVAKNALIKIHLLTSAPYSSVDNAIQDSAVQSHQTKVNDLNNILSGMEIRGTNNKLLISQFILVNSNILNYTESFAYSVLTYQCEFYHKEG